MVPQIPWFPPSLNMCLCDPALKKEEEKKEPTRKGRCILDTHIPLKCLHSPLQQSDWFLSHFNKSQIHSVGRQGCWEKKITPQIFPFFFLPILSQKNDKTLRANFPSDSFFIFLFFDVSSRTSEATSKAALSWLVTWKRFLIEGCRRVCMCERVRKPFLVSSKKKTDNKEKETDARFWTHPPDSAVKLGGESCIIIHDSYCSGRSGFIISHFELPAKFSPTAVASNYDNSNSRLDGILTLSAQFCPPTTPHHPAIAPLVGSPALRRNMQIITAAFVWCHCSAEPSSRTGAVRSVL